MDLSSPINSVIPSVHGVVLGILARTSAPLSGRAVAELSGGRAGVTRVSAVLAELAEAGLVDRQAASPAYLYRLNAHHVAFDAIRELADLRSSLLSRMARHVAGWTHLPVAVWLFGSMARGEGGPSSDIDVLIIRPDEVLAESSTWLEDLDDFSTSVRRWSGNRVEVVEFSASELADAVSTGDRLVRDLRRDAQVIFGENPSKALLRELTR